MTKPGDQISKYVLETYLGAGSNGAVYLARDTSLGRRVALKVLHPKFIHDAEVAGRFHAEASAMARLNHPNVVIVYDFIVGPENQWAIVMELVESGETLASVLSREKRLEPERALARLAEVAAGLGHAHARGIIHRDVKPANILIVKDGDREIAKLTDFGIARIVGGERRTHEQMTLGTLWYIAPEQAKNSSVDARADVYSLGITLYECLTGAVPFPYQNVVRVLSAHVAEQPVPPSMRNSTLPPAIDELVLRAIAKQPDARPAEGNAFASEIEQTLAVLRTAAHSRPIPATRLMSTADLRPPTRVSGPDPSASFPMVQVVPPTGRPPPMTANGSAGTAPPPSMATGGGSARSAREATTTIWIVVGIAVFALVLCAAGMLLTCTMFAAMR